MALGEESIKIRAYYLWEDDVKLSYKRKPDPYYYYLAEEIATFLVEYYFFEDAANYNYFMCSLCCDNYAKVKCVRCKQQICAHCMFKISKCPFCNNIRCKKTYLLKKK
jgi:hypothetical protein